MNRITIQCAVLALALAAPLAGHGGTYRGPGDTVPPGLGGGAAAPTAPAPPAQPGSPTTPGQPTTPSQPNQPTTPGLPVAPPTRKPPPQGVTIDSLSTDLTTWEFWWAFNKDRFLNLRERVRSGGPTTEGVTLIPGLEDVRAGDEGFAPTSSQIRDLILPALHAELRQDQQRDVLSSNLIALAKIGRDPGFGERVLPFLAHGNREIEETTALALGIAGNLEAEPILRALVENGQEGRRLVGRDRDVPVRTRCFAAYGLGLVARRGDDALRTSIASMLLDLLERDDDPTVDFAVACILAVGLVEPPAESGAAPRLLAYLQDESRRAEARAHCPSALARLLRRADADPVQRDAAIDALLAFGRARGGRLELRQSAVQSLGVLVHGDSPRATEVFDALVERQENASDAQERNFTAISLAYLGASNHGPLRERVFENLLGQLERGRTGYRGWAALGVGVLGFQIQEQRERVPDVVSRRLARAFEKEKVASRRAAMAIALGLLRAQEAAPTLVAALEHNDDLLVGSCAVGLGLMDAREARGPLLTVLQDDNTRTDRLRDVAIGLGLLGDPRATDALLGLLPRSEEDRRTLAEIAAAARALGFIGDHRSVGPLVRLVRSERLTGLGRAFAVAALGQVADKQVLPWNAPIASDLNYRVSVQTLVAPGGGSSGVLDIL